jgi:hypothetical protein
MILGHAFVVPEKWIEFPPTEESVKLEIFDILKAIFLSRTIATPPAVAPSTETLPVISHATLLKHTGHIAQFSFHRLGTSSL